MSWQETFQMKFRNAFAAFLLCGSVALPSAIAAEPVPDRDPAPEKPVAFPKAMQGKHPRLLWTPDEVPAIKKLAEGKGKPFYDQLLAYIGSCKPPKDTKFASDDTEAQRQGMWRMPTLCLHYALTGDKKDVA